MNYYPHHIGDYAKDTAHLTVLEDGTYRRLLDIYYSSERPLPLNKDGLYRLVRARSKEEKKAVDTILEEFFTKGETGWHNGRAEREIAKAQEKGMKAKRSAELRWHSERSANASTDAMRTHSEGNAPNNQEPIANNQEPKNKDTVGQKPDPHPVRLQAKEVLEFLNEKTGRSYEPVPANLDLIIARLKEGSSVVDLRQVVAKKCREWIGDAKMAEFLRPKTLFNRTNFAQYKGELVNVE